MPTRGSARGGGRTVKCFIGHDTQLIATIAAGLGLAFLLGLLAARLRLPLLLGYLAAGLIIGPLTPGFVADMDLARQLSEIGVSLLMFGVGLHFSIRDLLAVKKIAIPGALVQIAVATLLGAILVRFWGWSWGAGIVFGLCLSVASTVVLLRALGDRGEIETINGRIAVGWLIVEDLVTVIALVALPALSVHLGGTGPKDGGGVLETLGLTLGKVGLFAAAMLLIGKNAIPKLLGRVARTGSRELFTIGVLSIALGIAFGASALFGVSPALGAFFAGVVISESDLSHQAGAESRPIQDAFTVLFFVAVGMMMDPSVLINHPLQVLMALSIVLVGKSMAAFAIVLLFRFPISTALVISASLAQIGEFSFILVGLGIQLSLLPKEALSIILAVAILSIALNPIIFKTVEPIGRLINGRRRLLRLLEGRKNATAMGIGVDPHALRHHVVLVGFGRVGSTIAKALEKEGIPLLVVDEDLVVLEAAQENGLRTLYGDASREEIMSHTGLKDARLLIVATPAQSQARQIVERARSINPGIVVCVRTHDFEDAMTFEELGVERVVLGELELALEMSHFALSIFERSPDAVDNTIGELRALGSEALSRKAAS